MSRLPLVRRLAYVALSVAVLHLIFGAIVRISGSGMGCGDNWPKCHGYWFPPLTQWTLVVEVSHRYLASLVLLSTLVLTLSAWSNRASPEIGGRGGPLRSAVAALCAVLAVALLGALTVKVGNAAWATVAHFLGAMTVLGLLATTVIRAGGLGGDAVARERGSAKTARGAAAAAGLALAVVVLGGLTAKYPGAGVACLSFPLCGGNPGVSGAARGVQITHRVLALLLVLHAAASFAIGRRRRATESATALRALSIALALIGVQVLIAGAMIGMHLPPVLRSLHEATGVGIWLATFTFAYLARRAAGTSPTAA